MRFCCAQPSTDQTHYPPETLPPSLPLHRSLVLSLSLPFFPHLSLLWPLPLCMFTNNFPLCQGRQERLIARHCTVALLFSTRVENKYTLNSPKFKAINLSRLPTAKLQCINSAFGSFILFFFVWGSSDGHSLI